MQTDKIVIRFKDKRLMKGITASFSPEKDSFHMKLAGGEVVRVNINNLKAAFFVKRLDGNKNYKYKYQDVMPWGGNKIKVEFNDGEVLIGYAQNYLLGSLGFFVTPADIKGNNKRVFVVNSSTEKITFL